MNRLRNGEKPNPKNGKRVVLRFSDAIIEMDNINGTTGSWTSVDQKDREMLQNRSAFDAMVNSMLMLMGAEIERVEYYNIDEEEGE